MGDRFGTSVAVRGDTWVVGAFGEDGRSSGLGGDPDLNGKSASGAAYLFQPSGPGWVESAYLKASTSGTGDQFGWSMALSGDALVVSAPWEDSMAVGVGGDEEDDSLADAGAAYVFDLDQYEAWSDLGGGTPGIAGTPSLTGSGPLTAGSMNPLTISSAPPGAAMLLWIALAPTPFPAIGGTVHAAPFIGQLFLLANGSGSFTGAATWPTGVPPGTQAWFQFVIEDLSTVHGLTLSNGLLATTP